MFLENKLFRVIIDARVRAGSPEEARALLGVELIDYYTSCMLKCNNVIQHPSAIEVYEIPEEKL